MIFYDQTEVRKRLVRFSLKILLGLFLVLSSLLIFTVYQEGSPVAAGSIDEFGEMNLVLTFDDGPHPEQTEAILKVLKDKNVSAAFFFIGGEMLKYPEVVKKAYEDGHEIGNHTFTHSRQVHASKERLRFELQTTSQITEYLIGEKPRFYRSPYLLDFNEANKEFINGNSFSEDSPLNWATDLGYIGVSAYIDPRDWSLDDSATLRENVLERTKHGNIILLHDSGSQRDITLEALPFIIDDLRAEGFKFVSLSDLSGEPAYEENETVFGILNTQDLTVPILGSIYSQSTPALTVVAVLVLVLSILRLFVILGVRILPQPKKPSAYTGGVSVLIPAYNEEHNIAATIASAAASRYPLFEIIVIDDGSIDETWRAAQAASAGTRVPVRYLRKENGGKASALNLGFKAAKYDVVVAIDGDTIIDSGAMSFLSSHFNDPKVGAVAGRVSAITDDSWLSWFQDIEYTVSQNLEKTAFNNMKGSINVIPGAIGGWRKDAVLKVGGYSDDTLVEDQDITLVIHQQGYAVRYDSRAIAYTEVPPTVQSFFKQRFRWTFGTMQCLWKYKGQIFNTKRPKLSLVILPYGILFSLVTPLLMPVIDIILVYGMISGGFGILIGPILFFIVLDIIYHSFGLVSEPEKLAYLPLIPIQRIFYRILFSVIIVQCLIRAIEGTRTYWTTQIRTGSAQALLMRQQNTNAVSHQ